MSPVMMKGGGGYPGRSTYGFADLTDGQEMLTLGCASK